MYLWDEAKAGPGGKVCIYVHILGKEEKLKINYLSFPLSKLEKKKNTKLSPKKVKGNKNEAEKKAMREYKI